MLKYDTIINKPFNIKINVKIQLKFTLKSHGTSLLHLSMLQRLKKENSYHNLWANYNIYLLYPITTPGVESHILLHETMRYTTAAAPYNTVVLWWRSNVSTKLFCLSFYNIFPCIHGLAITIATSKSISLTKRKRKKPFNHYANQWKKKKSWRGCKLSLKILLGNNKIRIISPEMNQSHVQKKKKFCKPITKWDNFPQVFLILKWRNNLNSTASLANPLIAKSRKQLNASFPVVYTNRCVHIYVYLFVHYSNRDTCIMTGTGDRIRSYSLAFKIH